MRKRSIQIIVHLDHDEREELKALVEKSGYSQEAYIRSLIEGYIPADLPPPDYHAMLNELRAIGTNLNQIAQKAHVLNVVDAQRYDAAFSMLKQALVEIVRAVTQPRKIERKRE
jgi:predicted DNA-binding protein